jgi:hypothetical protein
MQGFCAPQNTQPKKLFGTCTAPGMARWWKRSSTCPAESVCNVALCACIYVVVSFFVRVNKNKLYCAWYGTMMETLVDVPGRVGTYSCAVCVFCCVLLSLFCFSSVSYLSLPFLTNPTSYVHASIGRLGLSIIA